MTRSPFRFFLLIAASLLLSVGTRAQNFENAGQYMDFIGKANENVTQIYLSYLSAVGHNKSARKQEKRRQEVIKAIQDNRFSIQGMAPWKGDRTYRDTTVAYFKLLYNVFNEDYAKIVNMEEIAEQSYDAMEAYMLAQEKANEKLNEASQRQQSTQKTFAEKYGVKLLISTSELDQKAKIAGALMKHYSDVYLIFFKAYKQEAYVMDALLKKNLTALEQSLSALKTYSEEGLDKLKDLNGYNNDPSIIVACRDALNFYKNESQQMAIATDFLLRDEAFTKAKKAMDAKPAAQRTQKDIDEFNEMVGDINKASNAFNSTNSGLNKQRDKVLNNWNNSVKDYLDRYMPVQRK